jgi:hypothetical protein
MPDALVAQEDYDQVNATIAALCRDSDANPEPKADLGDPQQWDTMEPFFYSASRCRVVFTLYKQLFEKRKPVAGVDLYLFKHEGKWGLLHWNRWVS